MNSFDLIKKAQKSALAGNILDRKSIIALLEIDPQSKECEELGKAAREAASVICKDRAYLWAAIGLDYKACSMNCRYCSLGEKWGIVKEENEFTEEEVMALVKKFVTEEARYIVLRTTQFYSLDQLIALASRIKSNIQGEYELGLNAGEFNTEIAKKIADAGVSFVYHTLRLREGVDTGFAPTERLATLKAVANSPLKLVSLIEPLGIEHTNEEIADAFLTAMKYKAVVTGCMERIPVNGTPLGALPAVSERRLAQVIAVTRLAAGFHAPDICVHRASELAIEWGANVAVVEKGAIPRDICYSSKIEWQGFGSEKAKEWFESKGYHVFSQEE
ncbi:MAG: radical SAM protein [Clostridia bacterium]|nr:radical SAM protein [Clostridia bacterium]